MQWQSASADTIAALVDLSASEVRELLGEESGCVSAELGQEVAAVLSQCQAILLPGTLVTCSLGVMTRSLPAVQCLMT